jgi:hypothetical protein
MLMAISLHLYVVKDVFSGRFYCPTQLHCGYASPELAEAVKVLGTLPDVKGYLDPDVTGLAEDHAVPDDGFSVTTAAQLLQVPWDELSEDPDGKIAKRAAWAYLAALPPETQIVVWVSR